MAQYDSLSDLLKCAIPRTRTNDAPCRRSAHTTWSARARSECACPTGVVGRDGLHSSVRAGRRAALAGVWAGGGGGIVAQPSGQDGQEDSFRRDLFQDYGEFLTSLEGCFVASGDTSVGARELDMMHARTRFVTGVSATLGGANGMGAASAAVAAQGVVRWDDAPDACAPWTPVSARPGFVRPKD